MVNKIRQNDWKAACQHFLFTHLYQSCLFYVKAVFSFINIWTIIHQSMYINAWKISQYSIGRNNVHNKQDTSSHHQVVGRRRAKKEKKIKKLHNHFFPICLSPILGIQYKTKNMIRKQEHTQKKQIKGMTVLALWIFFIPLIFIQPLKIPVLSNLR